MTAMIAGKIEHLPRLGHPETVPGKRRNGLRAQAKNRKQTKEQQGFHSSFSTGRVAAFRPERPPAAAPEASIASKKTKNEPKGTAY